MRKTESQKIALCGVLSALSVVVLLVGNVLQIGTYAAPMLASFLLIPVLEDYGKKYALLLYAVVSLLSLFLVPDKELVLFYVLVLGYYPVLRVRLNNIRRGVLRWMAKFGRIEAAKLGHPPPRCAAVDGQVWLLQCGGGRHVCAADRGAGPAGTGAGVCRRRYPHAAGVAGAGQPFVLAV